MTGSRTIYVSLATLLFASMVVSARFGAVNISYSQMSDLISCAIRGQVVAPEHRIEEGVFFQIRVPRVLLCTFVGAALAISGTMMQALFRNPIVEPGLVGTSAGAAFGAALVFVVGRNIPAEFSLIFGSFLMPLVASLFSFASTMTVYKISSFYGRVTVATMILAGIAMNAIAGAGTGFLAYIARDPQARSITFWSMGTFTGADWNQCYIVGLVTICGIVVALKYSKALNALLLGESEAHHLGIDTEQLKRRVILLNTIVVAVATSMVGVIGFVGLIVPHILRMLKGSDNRYLLIGSAFLGAIVMNVSDMTARSVLAPAELPIGIVTAFVGAPVFLWLLLRSKRQSQGGGFYA
jgi:iron complex transport system permease protein